MIEQLIKKDCNTGEYEDMFPITTLSAVKDLSTGKTLDRILEDVNHIYLPFKYNSKALTRQQVPMNVRRKGLWITYTSCMDKITTEWYTSDDYSNSAWGNNENWEQLSQNIIEYASFEDIDNACFLTNYFLNLKN